MDTITDDYPLSASEALFVAGSIALRARDAIEERVAAIRRARDAGASVSEIAVTTGLTEHCSSASAGWCGTT
jgi:hypothetical protein